MIGTTSGKENKEVSPGTLNFDEEYSRALLREQGHLSQHHQEQHQIQQSLPIDHMFEEIDFSLIDRKVQERKEQQQQQQQQQEGQIQIQDQEAMLIHNTQEGSVSSEYRDEYDIEYDMNGVLSKTKEDGQAPSTVQLHPPQRPQQNNHDERKMEDVFSAAISAISGQRLRNPPQGQETEQSSRPEVDLFAPLFPSNLDVFSHGSHLDDGNNDEDDEDESLYW